MNTKIIVDYLADLEKNNEREWYHANKRRYQEANAEFEDLLQELIVEIGKFDSSILYNKPKDLTFKLVRDTRYSHDKSPYNPTFRAHIAKSGKLPVPVGYFISIRPGDRSFIGGGLFAPMFKDATAMIRDYIVKHGDEFEKIITEKAFSSNFNVMGEALKNVPAGYDPSHLQSLYLKNKSWYLEYEVKDELFLNQEQFIKVAAEKFALMLPFNTYLNKALQDFQMPTR